VPPKNWFELVVIVLALGSGAIGALAKKIREQAEKKRAQDALMRAELERLRTGRDPEQPAEPLPQPVAEPELVRKRREHIERLRRASQAATEGAVVIQVPGAGPIVIARPTARPAPTARPVPPGMRPAPPRRESKRRAKPIAPPAPAPSRTPHILTPTESTTRRRVDAYEPAAAPAPAAATAAAALPRSREDWRRLVVMQEVLSPPLALREP
jgi:hypothetical protein